MKEIKIVENECKETCPYKNEACFDEYQPECKNGSRIRLDKLHLNIVEAPGKTRKVMEELAIIACGSELSPDSYIPTISAQDYQDTELNIPTLKVLYDKGFLPEQGLDK